MSKKVQYKLGDTTKGVLTKTIENIKHNLFEGISNKLSSNSTSAKIKQVIEEAFKAGEVEIILNIDRLFSQPSSGEASVEAEVVKEEE